MGLARLQRVPDESQGEMVAFKAACTIVGVHYNTGYKLKREDRFPVEVLAVGGRFFCRQADLDEYTHRQRGEAV
jgi:hypothetical protein